MKVLHSEDNVHCEQLWTLSAEPVRLTAGSHITPTITRVFRQSSLMMRTLDINQTSIAAHPPLLVFNSDLNSHVSFIFTLFECQSVGSVFIMSFDLATRLWSQYLISPYNVAASIFSLIWVHDNAVLICAGHHWLSVYGCISNFRHLNIPGVDFCFYLFIKTSLIFSQLL